MVDEEHDDCDIIVHTSPRALIELLDLTVRDLPCLGRLCQSWYDESSGYALMRVQEKTIRSRMVKAVRGREGELTSLGLLWTMSTASWFVKCSQRPSDAKMMNLSLGCRSLMNVAGSALRTGRRRGSGRWNLGNVGSRANSGLFRYASPMDLDTCKNHQGETS